MEVAAVFFARGRGMRRAVTRPAQDLAMDRYARGDESAFAVSSTTRSRRGSGLLLLRQTRSEARAKRRAFQQTMLKI